MYESMSFHAEGGHSRLSLLLTAALVFSLFPAGVVKAAETAESDTLYFVAEEGSFYTGYEDEAETPAFLM